MENVLTKEEKFNLVKVLPKKLMHNCFGICWDKTETYTITEVAVDSIKTPITINSILKSANVEVSINKLSIIVYSWVKQDYSWRKPSNNVIFFSVNNNKKIWFASGAYSQKQVLENLRSANNIVVIQADTNSLIEPKEIDLNKEYNDDKTLYNRVKIIPFNRHVYNETTCEVSKQAMSMDEMRSLKVQSSSFFVQLQSTGEQFSFRSTWSCLDDVTLADVIDKSGYNKNRKRISLSFELDEFKANKVREQVKDGSVLKKQAQILNLFEVAKQELAKLVTRVDIDNIQVVGHKANSISRITYTFKNINNRVNEIGTDKEYTGYTVRILETLSEVEEKLNQVIEEMKQV